MALGAHHYLLAVTVSQDIVSFVQTELSALADPTKAGPMQAYMKTEMPFYGVQKPLRVSILGELRSRYAPTSTDDYRANVVALWNLEHREEKYLAIAYAWAFKKYVTFDQLDLYERMIRAGAWWDLVDELAIVLVGRLVGDHRARMRPVLENWIDNDDMWLRRAALICQIRLKGDTDAAMLFDFCLRRAHEKEFFIRKAIGWALREYAKVEPDSVRSFLGENGDKLSGLSRREAAKHL
jgi:3-methyladenine DNA glycosylase AlkD